MKQLERIAILTNIVNPYRNFFYQKFHDECKKQGVEFTVMCMGDREPGRHWFYDDYKTDFSILLPGKVGSLFGRFTYYINPTVMRYVKRVNPDILLMAGSYMMPTNWIAISRGKMPIIYWNEAHKNEKRNYNKLVLNLRERIRHLLFSRFAGFWYSGRMSQELINDYKKEDAKMYFLPNLIDCSAFSSVYYTTDEKKLEIRNEYGIPNDKKVLLCPARLHWVKGIHVFMDVLYKSTQKENVCVLVAGDGEMEHELKAKSQSLGLDIRFLGYKEQREIIKLYMASDFFLMPSLSDPNPLTTIEALWGGKPLIVSSHVGNYPEAVVEGKNGTVLDYSDMDKAVKQLDEILGKDMEWFRNAKEVSFGIANTTYNPDYIIPKVVNQMKNDFETGKL